MAKIIEIADFADPALDAYARLTEAQLRSRQEPEKGIFIAEGVTVIGHALDAGYVPVSFLMERKHIEGKARETLMRCDGDTPVYTADSAILERLTGFALTRGVLCAMKRKASSDMEAILTHSKRVAILEDIIDPTNVGAIFRAAAALGMDAVLLSPSCCDPLNRRAVRVSMGTVFQVPWARMDMEYADWPKKGAALLKNAGFTLAALALTDNAISIDDMRLKNEEKLAVILGTEGDGLKYETIAACDYTVIIPMAHGVDSLNVAAASAVAFWELSKTASGGGKNE